MKKYKCPWCQGPAVKINGRDLVVCEGQKHCEFSGPEDEFEIEEAEDEKEEQGCGAAVAAIQFAISNSEGIAFLRCWNEGDFEAIRRDWPEAPEDVFLGLETTHTTGK